MRRPRRRLALLVSLALGSTLGCPGPRPGEPDGSVPSDSGVPDASIDAGPDAGAPDAGDAGDAGLADASVPDGGLLDGGDGGNTDGGLGLPDAGDGGEADGGLLDAGDGGGDAGPPPVIFSAQVIDFCNNYTPLGGVQVSLLGGGASAITDSQGNFQLPVQAGVPFTEEMQLTGYQTAYVGEVSIQSDVTLTVTQFPMVCTSLYQSLTSSLSSFNANEGLIFAKIYTLATSGSCTDQSGWAYQISPSGGESYVYFDVTGSPDTSLTSTAPYGIGAIYNVAASRVLLSAQKPDAGCSNADSAVGLTGYIDLAPGILSLGGYFIQ